MNISAVSASDSEVLALIDKAALPVEDINDKVELFAIRENEHVLGTIGMEHDDKVALLRSLNVDVKQRGKGYGDALVKFLENVANDKGIQTIYLLTTTAEAFFSKQGYLVVCRNEVPQFIQHTSEFSSVCPASAIVMKKELR